ncbi:MULTISPECIES: Fur family transcriptional regulator [Streptomyces]|jgi:Fur family ferric uptake transcriptional regulator|uniref:Fur family transcriptional regulator n=1 Tax=Streptomyces TaxID=1883 RepID=UPI001C30D2FC|nr:transcriptional repressor [Streptomyces sp. GbtcB7]
MSAQTDDLDLFGRRTAQRTSVLRALIDNGGFVGARTLYNALEVRGSAVGLNTVYRTLAALVEAGRADVVRDGDGGRLFRYRPSAEHQHYLLCRACGLSAPVDSEAVETWAEHVARSSGFAEVEHTVELTGLCPQCRGS